MSFVEKVRGIQTSDGAGANPVRIFPSYQLTYIDPFIMMDYFSIQKPAGFPSHPHRGFEIITYVLEGALEHKDSAGHSSVIHAGEVQKVTAGSGIVHSEMPGTDGINSGLQLWINMPRAEKGVDPSYQDFTSDQIPVRNEHGVTIRTIVGEGSPITLRRPMVYSDYAAEKGTSFSTILPKGYQGFIYVISGEGTFTESQVAAEEGELLLFEQAMGNEEISVKADDNLRFVLVAGEPIGETPRYNGPFVD